MLQKKLLFLLLGFSVSLCVINSSTANAIKDAEIIITYVNNSKSAVDFDHTGVSHYLSADVGSSTKLYFQLERLGVVNIAPNSSQTRTLSVHEAKNRLGGSMNDLSYEYHKFYLSIPKFTANVIDCNGLFSLAKAFQAGQGMEYINQAIKPEIGYKENIYIAACKSLLCSSKSVLISYPLNKEFAISPKGKVSVGIKLTVDKSGKNLQMEYTDKILAQFEQYEAKINE